MAEQEKSPKKAAGSPPPSAEQKEQLKQQLSKLRSELHLGQHMAYAGVDQAPAQPGGGASAERPGASDSPEALKEKLANLRSDLHLDQHLRHSGAAKPKAASGPRPVAAQRPPANAALMGQLKELREAYDWRQTEVQKPIVGESRRKGSGKKIAAIGACVVVLAGAGWFLFAPSSAEVEPVEASGDLFGDDFPLTARPRQVAEPPPRPWRDQFVLQMGADGRRTIAYTIQPGDDLFKIGEKLHDVSGIPRLVTHQAVEDAYWRKFFSYEDRNMGILSPAEVERRSGEVLQIPDPIPDFPEYEMATGVDGYNRS